MRKHFLLSPDRETPPGYVKAFCECKGLGSLFYVTSSYYLQRSNYPPADTKTVTDLANGLINDMITNEIVVEFVLAHEEYMKAVCLRVEEYLDEYISEEIDEKRQVVEKWIGYLTFIMNYLNHTERQDKFKEFYFSQKVINIMKDVVQK